ncbi:uncharacterized protein METZ01_LOCUS492345, partial [marine metagenome]
MPKKKRAKYDGGSSVKFSTNVPSVGKLNLQFDPRGSNYSADIGAPTTRLGVRGSLTNPEPFESVHASTKIGETEFK